ncbi:MAG TPA: porin [Polyangia bacterium]|nr:porin [Polyangia bacterium]
MSRAGRIYSEAPSAEKIRRARVAAAAALIGCLLAARPGRAEDDRGQPPPTYPLTLLVQADAVLASAPAPFESPDDPPAGAALRLRRLRVGDDLRWGDVRLRALFEAQPNDAAGVPFAPLAGGRLPVGGPLRAADLYLSWAPVRAFHLDAGSMRVPFSLSRQTDEADLRMLERPGFVEAFLPDYRAGVAVGGDLGELLYQAAILSADRTLDGHLFGDGALCAGRLTAEPVGPVGLAPWRLPPSDPWYDWFRFAASLSVLYGTVAEPRTLAIDPDFQAQWRWLVVTAEYLLSLRYRDGATIDPSSYQQGAAVEPGVTLLGRRLDLVARGDWQRAAAANSWGAGAGLTAYAPDPRLRLGAGFEWRHGPTGAGGADTGWYWAILRLTIAVE